MHANTQLMNAQPSFNFEFHGNSMFHIHDYSRAPDQNENSSDSSSTMMAWMVLTIPIHIVNRTLLLKWRNLKSRCAFQLYQFLKAIDIISTIYSYDDILITQRTHISLPHTKNNTLFMHLNCSYATLCGSASVVFQRPRLITV